MLRLHPPAHSVPDNFWHTLMLGAVASFFVWHTGQQVADLFMTDSLHYPHEQVLLSGQGMPLEHWLLGFAPEETRLIWGRSFSSLGWLLALWQIIRGLKPQHGFVGTLPSLILMLTLPGLSAFMCGAGSGSWALVFFLKAFFTINKHETRVPMIRGGSYAGVAVLISPFWFLPVLGILLGCWELFRHRLKWVGAGLGGCLATGTLVLLLSGQGLGWLLPGPGSHSLLPGGWINLLHRHLLLAASLVLILVYGSKRRGLGWWSLVSCLPLLILQPLLAAGPPIVLLPLWVFVAVGVTKLPGLMDVPFPRAYQSVLLCQLLLWMPMYTPQPAPGPYQPSVPDLERPAP